MDRGSAPDPVRASRIHSGIQVFNVKKQSLREACFPTGSGKPEIILYENIVWAQAASGRNDTKYRGSTLVDISYMRPRSAGSDTLDLTKVRLILQDRGSDGDSSPGSPQRSDVAESILNDAYRGTKRKKRLLVLINPHGGRGRAQSIYAKQAAPVFQAAGCEVVVITTSHRYHAQEVAQGMELDRFDAIVCCSGDGIPHEVINGLSMRPDGKRALVTMPVVQLPGGSGNSMAVSLNGSASSSLAALNIVKGSPMPMDLMCVSYEDKKTISFLSQAYGVVADCDLGTEHMRWMGPARFSVGAIQRAITQTKYPCHLYVKYSHESKRQVSEHFNRALSEPVTRRDSGDQTEDAEGDFFSNVNLKYGTVNDPVPDDWTSTSCDDLFMFYVGKMPWMSSDALVFPAALPTDGTMDLLAWDTTIGRYATFELLAKVETGKHMQHEATRYSKIEAYRLVPKTSLGYVDLDGELFPFVPFQVEVAPAAGCVLSATGAFATNSIVV